MWKGREYAPVQGSTKNWVTLKIHRVFRRSSEERKPEWMDALLQRNAGNRLVRPLVSHAFGALRYPWKHVEHA